MSEVGGNRSSSLAGMGGRAWSAATFIPVLLALWFVWPHLAEGFRTWREAILSGDHEPILITAPRTPIRVSPTKDGEPAQGVAANDRRPDGARFSRHQEAQRPLSPGRTLQDRETIPANGTPDKQEVYRIQIAAMQSLGAAWEFWASQQRAHDDLLGGLEPAFPRIERDEQELFRVQAGVFTNSAEAKKLCDALERRDLSCLVRGP